MTRILFVCHGNICRSPMAEFIFKDIVKRHGVERLFDIASAAISYEEEGCEVYPQARKMLAKHFISSAGKRARRMDREDYDKYDLLIYMDSENRRGILRIIGSDTQNKLHPLLEYTGEYKEVDDPWYTRDFEKAYAQIERGCNALFDALMPSQG